MFAPMYPEAAMRSGNAMAERGRAYAAPPPLLVVNPGTDRDLVALAYRLVSSANDPAALQALLRKQYPQAVVRPRELSRERLATWYVYRDGRWVDPRTA
jgi:hypothetical protein